MPALLDLGESVTSGSLRVECFQPYLEVSGELHNSSPCINSLGLSKFLLECVAGQFSLLILGSPCWMEVPWFLTVLNTLEEIPYPCSIIKDFIRNASVGNMDSGLPSLHLPFGCSETVY